MKSYQANNIVKLCITLLLLITLPFNGCRKKQDVVEPSKSNKQKAMRKLQVGNYIAVDNPYRVENVKATIEKYKNMQTEFTNYTLNENQIDVYVKIKATDIPADKGKGLMEKQDLFDFPLDAAMLFEPGITEERLNTIKGDYLFTYLPKNSKLLQDYPFQKIYEVYKPEDNEKWLDEAILFEGDMLENVDKQIFIDKLATVNNEIVNGGGNNSHGKWAIFGFLIPKKPAGKIQYRDSRLGIVGVINVKVIAIKLFGIVSAQTDVNGNFAINSNFWIGTIIFTKYTNSNITIVPWDISSNFNSVLTFITSFFVGSLSFPIWHSKSQLPNISILHNDFRTQANFWSHIINMDHFHRQYCAQEGIFAAPTQLLFRATWENKPENSAGTLMIPHILIGNNNMQAVQNFSNTVNITDLGTLFTSATSPIKNLLTLIMPDVKVSSGPGYILNFAHDNSYSSDISKTILHELSHASMYTKVGDLYWILLGMQEKETDNGGNYGWGNITNNPATWLGGANTSINNAQPNPGLAIAFAGTTLTFDNTCDNFIELSEAWAEFLGENYARRIYTGAAGSRMCNPLGGGANGNLNNFPPLPLGKTPYQLFSLSSKMEKGHAWADIWIPCGMFHDLMDTTNTDPNEVDWDKVGGYTIAEMYHAFDISRPAHDAYLEHIAPIHGFTFGQVIKLFDNNKGL